jgi:peptide deformylase
VAVREIRLYGDPVLRTVCEPVGEITPQIEELVADLLETTQLPGRAGVAAPQIGVNLRVFSYFVHGELGYLINPRIVEVSGEPSEIDEGCLSVPELWEKTPRYPHAVAEGINLAGETVRIEGSGLLSQALQHECDHLDGKVYLDRLSSENRKIAMRKLRETSWF